MAIQKGQAIKNPPSSGRESYAFGRFRLSADGTLLTRDGVTVALAPKVLQTLLVLVEHAGQVVRKADLLTMVWPDSFVEETGLSRNISLLRQALDDDAQTTIVTVARIGYRFAAPVSRQPAPAAGGSDSQALKRLLILPFRQLRDDPDIAFLAFSVPDAVINALSGLTSLVVRSSAAASQFRHDVVDLGEIAEKAAVDAVLTGTLARSGQYLRVSAQLAAVPDGAVRWSESFQVSFSEVFELQDRLVKRIVRSLSLSLTAPEQHRITHDVPASPLAYEFFLRGNECVGPQGISRSSNLRVARELYARAIEEDPRFAPAWVRLGRCYHLIGKSAESPEADLKRAESCFQKALELSPDLPLAQNLYALFEIDQGRARQAMVRLVARGLAGSVQPELYAALVQACRFCGLLEPSIVAHKRARELDSTITTGGYLAYWQIGDEDAARRESVNLCWLVDALILGMRGERERALDILMEDRALTGLARNLVASLRAVFEGRPDHALESAQPVFDACPDPEMVFFVARNVAFFGEPAAIRALEQSLRGGFVLYRVFLRHDRWLDPLRASDRFQRLFEESREVYRQCRQSYVDAGGESLLGPVPEVGELDAAWAAGTVQQGFASARHWGDG